MANGVKFSQNWEAVRSRIRRLPKFAEGVADSQRKRDAHELVSYWRSGLKNNSLGLIPLQPRTIARKKRASFSNPDSPLYGLGLDGARTYVKGMHVFKTKNGYRVQMIDGRHHSSKLSIKALFTVHEYGTTINRNGKVIRIPPRPAMQKAFEMVMNRLFRNDPSREFRIAAIEFLKKGFSGTAKAIESRARLAEGRNNG